VIGLPTLGELDRSTPTRIWLAAEPADSLSQVSDAVQQALGINTLSVDAVRLILQQRQEKPVGLFCLDGRPHLKSVQVQTPDLQAYRCLLTGGAA
jgi:hypothetical protein